MNTAYNIEQASMQDMDTICRLFDEAIIFQKAHNYIGWETYDEEYLKADVKSGLLFKVITASGISGIFSICYTDRLIWREMEKGNALYLHRIVLNREFRGEKIFRKILDWSLEAAANKRLRYIRMDTWAENEKIISYYKSYGFSFIENYTTPATGELPVQHRNLKVALLELELAQ
jgi:ribosomal protein S18 acetylase RimI-like enzyme